VRTLGQTTGHGRAALTFQLWRGSKTARCSFLRSVLAGATGAGRVDVAAMSGRDEDDAEEMVKVGEAGAEEEEVLVGAAMAGTGD
jgi:hypothetical protein